MGRTIGYIASYKRIQKTSESSCNISFPVEVHFDNKGVEQLRELEESHKIKDLFVKEIEEGEYTNLYTCADEILCYLVEEDEELIDMVMEDIKSYTPEYLPHINKGIVSANHKLVDAAFIFWYTLNFNEALTEAYARLRKISYDRAWKELTLYNKMRTLSYERELEHTFSGGP